MLYAALATQSKRQLTLDLNNVCDANVVLDCMVTYVGPLSPIRLVDTGVTSAVVARITGAPAATYREVAAVLTVILSQE